MDGIVLCPTSPDQLKSLQRWGNGLSLEYRSSGRVQILLGSREPPDEQDYIWIEDIDEGRQASSEGLSSLLQELQGPRGPGISVTQYVLTVLHLYASLSCGGSQTDGRAPGLEAASGTTATQTVTADEYMSQLGPGASRSDQRYSIDNHAASDTRSQCEQDQIFSLSSEGPRSESGCVGVVDQGYGTVDPCGDLISKLKIPPLGEVRRFPNHAVLDEARNRDAQGAGRIQLLDEPCDGLHHTGRASVGQRCGQDLRVRGSANDGSSDATSADVDSDGMLHDLSLIQSEPSFLVRTPSISSDR